MADDDARDERLGRLLEVEPLDEVARRRLVSAAMRSAAPPARRRFAVPGGNRFVAAAAVVAILVAGIGFLALRGNDSTAPSASPSRPRVTTPVAGSSAKAAPTSQAATPDSTADRSESSGANATSGAAPPSALGDVGDLAVAANLDRLRTSTAATEFGSTRGGEQVSNTASLVTRLQALDCAAQLPAGTVVAIGTGHFGSRDALVVVTTLADGTTSLDAVLTHPCEVRPLD
jgi:hypothetical protein